MCDNLNTKTASNNKNLQKLLKRFVKNPFIHLSNFKNIQLLWTIKIIFKIFQQLSKLPQKPPIKPSTNTITKENFQKMCWWKNERTQTHKNCHSSIQKKLTKEKLVFHNDKFIKNVFFSLFSKQMFNIIFLLRKNNQKEKLF